MADDRDRGVLVLEPSARAASQDRRELPLDELPESVLDALREIGAVREDHLKQLSAGERRVLAACERLRARYIDLQAQIDAGGKR